MDTSSGSESTEEKRRSISRRDMGADQDYMGICRGISYAKALAIVAVATKAKLPSKGAFATYAKRNEWQRGYAPVQAKPIAPCDNSDIRIDSHGSASERLQLGRSILQRLLAQTIALHCQQSWGVAPAVKTRRSLSLVAL